MGRSQQAWMEVDGDGVLGLEKTRLLKPGLQIQKKKPETLDERRKWRGGVAEKNIHDRNAT